MARSGVRDPLDKFRWTVDIPGFSKLGFNQCGTPKYVITPREYVEAGSHLNPKVIIDRVQFAPITLSMGVTNDTSFAKWASSPWDLVQNNVALKSSDTSGVTGFVGSVVSNISDNGASPVPSDSDYPYNYRRKVKIEHVNRAGQVEVIYILYNAIPIAYQPASDFDATDDGGVSIQTLTLAYEGFEVRYTGLAGAVGNFLAGTIL